MIDKIVIRSFDWQGNDVDEQIVSDHADITQDFSAANDAALFAEMADQHEDYLDWRWSVGDLAL